MTEQSHHPDWDDTWASPWNKWHFEYRMTAEELADRKDVASVQSLDRVAVLIKPGVEESSVISVMQEKYGLEPEKALLSEGVHGDKIYLFVKTSENVKRE